MLIETNIPKRPFVLIALNTTDFGYKNVGESEIIASLGRNFKEVIGCYKDIKEQSYLIDLSLDNEVNAERIDNNALSQVLALAAKYNQESVLLVDSSRKAYLIYVDDERMESLGQFTNVAEYEAMAADAWTVSKGRYYVCK